MKKQKKRILYLSFILAIPGIILPAYGQEMLTLNDAISLALERNQHIEIARNNEQISRNSAAVGNAGLLPRLDISSGINYSDITADDDNIASTRTDAGIQASYALFNGFNNIYYYKNLKSSAEAGMLSARNAIENEILRVASGYISVGRAAESVKITGESAAISRERYERATNKGRFGQANKIDLLNAEVDLNADSVSYYNALLNMTEAKRNLNVLLNREPDHNYSIGTDLPFRELPDAAELCSRAEKNNAEYLIEVSRLRQTEYDYKMALSAYYPHLSVQSSYGYQQQSSDFAIGMDNPDKSFTAGATLSYNLFDGRQKSIRRQNARIQIDNQKLLQQEARLNLEKEVKNALAAYENSRYILQVQQNNLESYELNFTRTSELFELGRVNSTQFREAQLNLFRARTNIANSKFDANIYEFQLLKLIGELMKS